MPSPKVKHRSTILDPTQIAKLLKDIHNYTGHVVVQHALKLQPLLFVRPGELRHAEWTEIDWHETQWRIPDHKMKMKVTHIIMAPKN